MKRVLAIAAMVLWTAPAAAQGILSGYACGTLPASYSLDVQMGDDSRQMLKIRDAAVRALERKNIPVSANARFVLTIDVFTTREGAVRKKPDLGSVSDGSSEDFHARMNLWSNSRDSVVGGRRDEIVKAALDKVRVEIAINDKSDGKCIWRGDAHYDSGGDDQWDIAEKTALRLIGMLGKNARDRAFTIL